MKSIQNKMINIKQIETIIIAVVWFGVFSIPFFTHREAYQIVWSKVVLEWLRIAAFLIIFILNVKYFVPRFLILKRYKSYILFSIISLLFVLGCSIGLQQALKPAKPLGMPRMELGPGMPPMELGNNMPAPMGYVAPVPVEEKSLTMEIFDNLVIALLVFAAGTMMRVLSQWLMEEDRRKDAEKEQLKTELALLRHQVSPHFFMNTLNNIHALIDINSESAKDAVIRLSTLMRYLLYDSARGNTSLRKEVEFIESYISLMRLRFSKKVEITVDIPEKIPDIEVPPMLFISFVENAFKHGVSYNLESYVSFKLEVNNEVLKCRITNSNNKHKELFDKSYSGIGMKNIKKSLDLLFGKSYKLAINESEKEFEVNLTIPIYESQLMMKNSAE